MTTKLQQFCIDILPVVQAGAKGARIGVVMYPSGELRELDGLDMVFDDVDAKYQIIRDMIEVNGFKVPAGEKLAPIYGVAYHIPAPNREIFVDTSLWDNDGVDLNRLRRGIVYLNKEDAIARAKAMLGIDPYAEQEFDDAGEIPE